MGQIDKGTRKMQRNSWYFSDKKTPICQQVWLIGQAYYKKMLVPEGRARHRIKNPTQLVKLFYLYYLTGIKQQQAFRQPFTIEIVHEPAKDYVNIKHQNDKRKGAFEVFMCIPVLDEHEKSMWDFITDLGTTTNTENIFEYKKWKSTKKNNITMLFNKNFITTLEDPIERKPHKNQGVSPQIIRYMRFKNLILDHRAPERILSSWFGCDIGAMINRHPELLKALDLKEQRQELERVGLMPNLRLGMGNIAIS